MGRPASIASNPTLVLRMIKRLYKQYKRPPTYAELQFFLRTNRNTVVRTIRELRIMGFLLNTPSAIPTDTHISFDKDEEE